MIQRRFEVLVHQEQDEDAVNYHLAADFDANDPSVKEVKDAEIIKFREFQIFDEVKDTGHAIPTRWVIKTKNDRRSKLNSLMHPQLKKSVKDSCSL